MPENTPAAVTDAATSYDPAMAGVYQAAAALMQQFERAGFPFDDSDPENGFQDSAPLLGDAAFPTVGAVRDVWRALAAVDLPELYEAPAMARGQAAALQAAAAQVVEQFEQAGFPFDDTSRDGEVLRLDFCQPSINRLRQLRRALKPRQTDAGLALWRQEAAFRAFLGAVTADQKYEHGDDSDAWPLKRAIEAAREAIQAAQQPETEKRAGLLPYSRIAPDNPHGKME